MKEKAEEHEETWVRLPPRMIKRLESVARSLHCTTPEAAMLAIRTQLDRLEAPLAGSGQAGAPRG